MSTTEPTPEKGKRTPRDWEAKFLETLAKTGNVSESARRARIDRTIPYDLRKDPAAADFKAAWDSAMETAGDLLEKEAWRRAVSGVRKPTGWYQGRPGGYVREYSDTLLIFLLKAHRPEKFRERLDVTSGGDKVGTVSYITENRANGGDEPAGDD